jgi:hypothetical protein
MSDIRTTAPNADLGTYRGFDLQLGITRRGTFGIVMREHSSVGREPIHEIEDTGIGTWTTGAAAKDGLRDGLYRAKERIDRFLCQEESRTESVLALQGIVASWSEDKPDTQDDPAPASLDEIESETIRSATCLCGHTSLDVGASAGGVSYNLSCPECGRKYCVPPYPFPVELVRGRRYP